jgi:phosphoserine phosphatase RsbU/P
MSMCGTESYLHQDVRSVIRDPQRSSSGDYSLSDDSAVCLDGLTNHERNALEGELAQTVRTQRALLPNHDFAPLGWQASYHYEPAGLLSGDYCDLLETKTGFLFLLGDVSGKGVAAAMRVTQLHATFRTSAEADLPLHTMMETANRMFSGRTSTGQIATVVAGRAERDGSVEFVSAGHLPFLHLSKGLAHEQGATGIPLGVLPGTQFAMRRFRLDIGDALLLFSDGLTESVNSAGAEYGLERLKAVTTRSLTRPSGLITECLSDRANFTAGARPKDDLSLLVIRRII